MKPAANLLVCVLIPYVQDRGDGAVEAQLYIRQIAPQHFKHYTLVAENSVSARSQDAVLKRSKSTLMRCNTVDYAPGSRSHNGITWRDINFFLYPSLFSLSSAVFHPVSLAVLLSSYPFLFYACKSSYYVLREA